MRKIVHTIVRPSAAVSIPRSPGARRTGRAACAAALLLALLLGAFSGPAPASAADPALPIFGEGSVEVRVYTDYFCGPCAAEEKELMAAIAELVAKNRIRVLLIDTPLFPETALYAEYFLAALNAKREFSRAVAARAALFEAARLKMRGKAELEAFLAKQGVEVRLSDPTPVFTAFSRYIKEDRINSTPTVVIAGPRGKQVLGSKEQILKALADLRN